MREFDARASPKTGGLGKICNQLSKNTAKFCLYIFSSTAICMVCIVDSKTAVRVKYSNSLLYGALNPWPEHIILMTVV